MAKTVETEELSIKLEKLFGKGTIIKASNERFTDIKEITSTGSLTLDKATKVGGVPKGGLITQILGKESSGKTTLALHIIAEEHKKNDEAMCAFLDVEGTFDSGYAAAIGVDLNRLHLVDQDMLIKHLKVEDKTRKSVSGEEWLDVLIGLLNTKEYGIIVLDSVATLTPLQEIQNGIAGGGQIARLGSLLSRSLRGINAALAGSNTGLIMLNQYRISPGKYGNPFVEAGGEALKYYTALKIELSKSLDKDEDGKYGIYVKAEVTKSKIGIPYGKCQYYIEFGKGIIRVREIFEIAVEAGIIEKGGSWFTLPGIETKIQGEDKVIQYLIDNPNFTKTIEANL